MRYIKGLVAFFFVIYLYSCNPLGVESTMGQNAPSDNTPEQPAKVVPIVSSINPSIGDVSGQTVIKIKGAYFNTGAEIYFDGTLCLDIEFISSTELRCKSPAHSLGFIDVVVQNPDGEKYTLSNGYKYINTFLNITGPNGGANFTTTELAQTIHGTCSKNISSLDTNVGVFNDDDCSDGYWSLQTYNLFNGTNSFVISAETTDGEASAVDSITINYITSNSFLEVGAPNSGANLVTNTQEQTISGTCSDDITNLSSNLGAFSDDDCSDGTWSLIPYDLSVGANNFIISGLTATNDVLSDSISIIYDITPPSVSISAPTPNNGPNLITDQNIQHISGTCSTDVSSLTVNSGYYFADSNCSDGTWSLTPSIMNVGNNSILITALDQAGNPATASMIITYDDIPRVLQITAPNNGAPHTTNNDEQTVSGTCSADVTGLTSSLGSFSDDDCSDGIWALSPYTLNVGANLFTISGLDPVGNTISDSMVITYDTVAPDIQITAPNAGVNFITDTQIQTISGTCSTDVVSLSSSIGNFSDADCSDGVWSLNPYILDPGINTFEITAYDVANNSANATIEVNYHNIPSVINVDSPNAGFNFSTNVQDQTVSGTCSTDVTGLTSSLGFFTDSNCSDGTWALSSTSLGAGANTFTISGLDPMGNTVSDSVQINYDTTPPTISISAPNAGADLTTDDLAQTVSGTCSTDTVILLSSKGNFADSNCSDGTWSLNPYVLDSGVNAFTITAYDSAGNSAFDTININYYTTPASFHITAPNGGVDFSTNIQDQIVSGTCSTDLTNLTSNTGSFIDDDCADGVWSLATYSLNLGSNIFTISALNPVGNPVSDSINIIYDLTDPTINISTPNAGLDFTTNVLVQTISGTCSTDMVGLVSSSGNFADNSCTDGTWSLNPVILESGINTFTITGYDGAGNFSNTTINIVFDDIAPSSPVLSATTPTTNTTPTWTWISGGGGLGDYRYKLDDSDLSIGATETSTASYTPSSPLSTGVHTLYVQEKDNADNWSLSGTKTVSIEACTNTYTWGRNLSGQLGIDASLPFVFTPTEVPNLSNVTLASAGGSAATNGFTIARKSDGTLWSWGTNDTGQLGHGTIGTTSVPKQVVGIDDVTEVQASAGYSVALDADGNVWSWGTNSTDGILGDGTTAARYIPGPVGGAILSLPNLSNITKIKATNTTHSLALASDQTVWAWGLNTSGELGDGTRSIRLIPLKVAGIVSKALTVSSVVQAGTTVTVTTSGNHLIQTGSRVNMSGWNMPTVNGTFYVTYASLTTFTYATTTATGTATGESATVDMPSTTLPIASVVGSAGTVAVTTSYIHGMAAGHKATVVMDGWSGGSGTWDGTYEVTVTSTTAFTYSATGVGTATGGTAILNGGVGALTDVIDIATGTSHSAALKSDGTVWVWGLGSSGQIGNNASISTNIPVQVQIAGGDPLTDITAIAAGANFTIARKNDGTVWAWGLGTGAQLGDGSILSKNYAVQVLSTELGGFLTGVSNNISAGGLHSLVVKNDGTVWAWGTNTSFQIGNGVSTNTVRNKAVQVVNLSDVVNVNAGFDFSLAVTIDGKVWAWGATAYSQTGVAEYNKLSPSTIYGFENESISEAGASVSNSVLVKADGTVWTAGINASGQLGVYLPVDSVSGDGSLVTVTTTDPHGLYSGQSVIMAGWTPAYNGTVYINVTGPNTFTFPLAITGAVTVAGTLQPTQLNNFKQVRGVKNLGFLTDVKKVRLGTAYMLALKTDGTVYGWGIGTSGQLGDGTVTTKAVPMSPVAGIVTKSLDIASVSQTTTTVTVDTNGDHYLQVGNRVIMSGWNLPTVNGRFVVVTVSNNTRFTYTTTTGSGTATNGTAIAEMASITLPITSVTGNGTTVTVTTAYGHGLAAGQKAIVVMDGWTGGTGEWNGAFVVTRVGSSTTVFSYPSTGNGTAVNGTCIMNGGTGAFTGVSDIRAGLTTSYALKADGTVWAWGAGTSGQLGNNLLFSTSFPEQVLTSTGTPLTNIEEIAVNASHVLALKEDGTVWGWGVNTNGRIGDGSAVQRNGAVQIPINDVIDVSAGVAHSLAVKSNGTVWAWGLNSSYQLGDGTVTQRNYPVQVLGIIDAVKVYAGGSIHSFAITSDGSVWSWGALLNNYGYLGTGTSGYLTQFPTKIPNLSRVETIAAGDTHSIAIQSCNY